jgi:hypothetical protein
MEFEHRVRDALNGVLAEADSQVVVDSARPLTIAEGKVVLVSYHLEGKLQSCAQFTFPFVEAVPLDESVAAFLDYGGRNWQTAHFAPGTIRQSQAAGAD